MASDELISSSSSPLQSSRTTASWLVQELLALLQLIAALGPLTELPVLSPTQDDVGVGGVNKSYEGKGRGSEEPSVS